MRYRTEDMPVALDLPGARFRVQESEDRALVHVELSAGTDATPLLKGLPGDMCSCPHWGYMLKGAIHVRYLDGFEEVCRAGEFFYWPSGHTVWVEEDTAFVEFSPRDELGLVYGHIREKAAQLTG